MVLGSEDILMVICLTLTQMHTLTYKIIPTPEVNPPANKTQREVCELQEAPNGGGVTQENSQIPAQRVAKVNLSSVHGSHLNLIGE